MKNLKGTFLINAPCLHNWVGLKASAQKIMVPVRVEKRGLEMDRELGGKVKDAREK